MSDHIVETLKVNSEGIDFGFEGIIEDEGTIIT